MQLGLFGVTVPNWILLLALLAYSLTAVIKAASNIKALFFVSILLLAYSMLHYRFIVCMLYKLPHTVFSVGTGTILLLVALTALIICSIIEFFYGGLFGVLKSVGPKTVPIYIGMVSVSIVLGVITGVMIISEGSHAVDPILTISWLVLFPMYIIADGILNSRFLWCSLRAAVLPLVEGVIIWLVTFDYEPFIVSLVVSMIYILGSLIVVRLSRAVRKSKYVNEKILPLIRKQKLKTQLN